MKNSFLLLSLIAVLNWACQPERNNDPLGSGFELIDRGQYTEAILRFQGLLEKSPDNPRLKMALASAYAGRAGVEIERFWDFYQELQAPPMTPVSLQVQPFYVRYTNDIAGIAPFLPGDIKADLDQLFLTLTAVNVYREQSSAYPYVEKEKRSDIEKAISVLNDESYPGERLYRAILTGVLVRSDLEDGFDFWTSLENPFAELIAYPLQFQRILCTPVTGDITSWMNQQLERAKRIARDLQFAYPSDAPKYDDFEKPVEAYQDEIPRIQAKLIPAGCNP